VKRVKRQLLYPLSIGIKSISIEIGEPDFWDDLPIHVKDEIQKPQNQYLAGETKSNEEGMENFKIYL